MRVALFSNQFASTKGFGLARYARELHAALVARGVDITPVAAWSDGVPPETTVLLPTGRRLTSLAWTFLGAPRLEALVPFEPTIVHAASLGYPIATKKPLVVTVHDLGPLTHPHYFKKARPFVMRRALLQAARADAIIAVSEFAREEFLTFAGAGARARTHVIPEAAAPLPPPDFGGLPTQKPFVLAVGQASPRKNFHGLVAAFAKIAGTVPHDLVIAGGTGWEAGALSAAIANTGLSARIHRTGFVTDATLAALYVRASVFVLPSFYEGFGLPVLEAMAAGAPVISSNVAALAEVAGDAALLVDPSDEAALSDALHAVLTTPALAERLSDSGRARAKLFSFEIAAQATERVYTALQ